MISPSEIALHAAGFDPISEYELEAAANCVMCGIAMHEGDLAAEWNPKDSFTNWPHLQAPNSKHLCPHCAGAWRKEFTQGWITGAIFNMDGVHRPNSTETLAHALLYPPAPPFVWIRGDQNQQHLVWRTPVTTDVGLLRIRLGEQVVSIRRDLVLSTLKCLRDAEVVLSELPKEKRPAKKANPGNEAGFFKYLDWGIDNVDHGLLSDGLIALAYGTPSDSAYTFDALKKMLTALNFGEVWALMILLKSKSPCKPEIVAQPKHVSQSI